MTPLNNLSFPQRQSQWKKTVQGGSPAPLFIVGCGRSGTTLLLSILGADRSFSCIPEESEILRWHIQPDLKACLHPGATLEELWAYNQELSQHLWENPAQRARVEKEMYGKLATYAPPPGTATHWVEKTPSHVRRIRLIRKFFGEEVRFIHIVRDGRDVITSKHPNKGREFHIHPERWVYDVSMAREFEDSPYVHVIRYEDLIRDFKQTMTWVYDFLGKAVPDEIFDFESNSSIQWHDAWRQKIQGLSDKSIGRWKTDTLKERIASFEQLPLCTSLLKHYGYESSGGVHDVGLDLVEDQQT